MPRRFAELAEGRRDAKVVGARVERSLDAFYRECAKSKISLIHLGAF